MVIPTGEIFEKLNKLFPKERSEPGDSVGLQIDPDFDRVSKVLIALDPSWEVLKEAIEEEVNLVITHHPLFYKPLDRIKRFDISREFIRSGIGLYVAHTNFDRDYLAPAWAEVFNLLNPRPIARSEGEKQFKLVVYVPEGYEEVVGEAIFSGGAGKVGRYDQTSFRSIGKGTFRPLKGAKPFIGEGGKRKEVKETRLETIVPQRFLPKVIDLMKRSHPYEEVAFDIFSLANDPDSGLGIIGNLPKPLGKEGIEKLLLNEKLAANLRWGDVKDRPRQKLALVPGKGGKVLSEAVSAGAEIFISGDIDFHQFQFGQSQDILVIDPGHFQLEIRGKKVIENLLKEEIPGVKTILAQRECCPYYHHE